jgi:hypothetical protein
VVIAHTTVKRVQPPGYLAGYDRYEIKLDPVNSTRLKEWADAVLFLNFDVRVQTNAEGKARGVGGRERVIYTTYSAIHDAKNRVGLPDKVECTIDAIAPLFWRATSHQEAGPETAAPIAKTPTPIAKTQVSQTQNSVPATGVLTSLESGTESSVTESSRAFLQEQLAIALKDIDAEVLRLFLLNRKVCSDGLIQSIPEDYAHKILAHPERFHERIAKFAREPF